MRTYAIRTVMFHEEVGEHSHFFIRLSAEKAQQMIRDLKKEREHIVVFGLFREERELGGWTLLA